MQDIVAPVAPDGWIEIGDSRYVIKDIHFLQLTDELHYSIVVRSGKIHATLHGKIDRHYPGIFLTKTVISAPGRGVVFDGAGEIKRRKFRQRDGGVNTEITMTFRDWALYL